MRVVRAVSMSPGTIEIAYMDDQSDIRGEAGSVYQVHTICVALDDPDLEEEAEDLETAVSAFLEAAVRRWATSMPVTPEEAFDREMQRMGVEPMPDDDDEEDER